MKRLFSQASPAVGRFGDGYSVGFMLYLVAIYSLTQLILTTSELNRKEFLNLFGKGAAALLATVLLPAVRRKREETFVEP